MAIEKPKLAEPAWAHPVWPERLPDPITMRLVFGADADELVVLFDNRLYHDSVFVWVTTPEYDYAAIKVEGTSGKVIGVLVYPLIAYAADRHPAWRAAAEPHPPSAVAGRIVSDIKNLFDRYGIEPKASDLR